MNAALIIPPVVGPWPYEVNALGIGVVSFRAISYERAPNGTPRAIANALFRNEWPAGRGVRLVGFRRSETGILIQVAGGECWKVSEIIQANTRVCGGVYEMEWIR